MNSLTNWLFAGGSMVIVALYVHLRIRYRSAAERIDDLLEAFNDMVGEALKFSTWNKEKERKIEGLVQHNLELIKQIKELKNEEHS